MCPPTIDICQFIGQTTLRAMNRNGFHAIMNFAASLLSIPLCLALTMIFVSVGVVAFAFGAMVLPDGIVPIIYHSRLAVFNISRFWLSSLRPSVTLAALFLIGWAFWHISSSLPGWKGLAIRVVSYLGASLVVSIVFSSFRFERRLLKGSAKRLPGGDTVD